MPAGVWDESVLVVGIALSCECPLVVALSFCLSLVGVLLAVLRRVVFVLLRRVVLRRVVLVVGG